MILIRWISLVNLAKVPLLHLKKRYDEALSVLEETLIHAKKQSDTYGMMMISARIKDVEKAKANDSSYVSTNQPNPSISYLITKQDSPVLKKIH